jgi:hypothetical protein
MTNPESVIYPENIRNSDKFSINDSFNSDRENITSNMDLSDHAHILHTGVFEVEEFNEKSFICRKLTVLEIFEIFNEFP